MPGTPVKVGWAPNQPQAELLQSLLLDYGIPSLVRRQLGFDLPDYLASGARDILVPPEAADDARIVLAPALLGPEAGDAIEPIGTTSRPPWVRIVALLLVAVLLVASLWSALGGTIA